MQKLLFGLIYCVAFAVLCPVSFCQGLPPGSAEAGKAVAAGADARERDPREIFTRANSLYEAGKYEGAAEEYSKLVSAGYRGGSLFYNLGNAYFKLDKKGEAILYYKKALKLLPRDQDVKSNLGYALSLIEDKIEPGPRSWFVRRWDDAVGYFGFAELTGASTAIYWLLCGVLVAMIYVRQWRRIFLKIAAGLLIFLAITVAGVFSRAYLEGQEEAVILAKETQVRYGPSDKDVVAFVLHEGTVVEIENIKADWYQISLPDGKAGWLKKGSLGLI